MNHISIAFLIRSVPMIQFTRLFRHCQSVWRCRTAKEHLYVSGFRLQSLLCPVRRRKMFVSVKRVVDICGFCRFLSHCSSHYRYVWFWSISVPSLARWVSFLIALYPTVGGNPLQEGSVLFSFLTRYP